jgi:hypothetical protein
MNPGVLTPSFRLNNGLFYTARKSEVGIRKRMANVPARKREVAFLVGANIYFDPAASEAVLRYGAGGQKSIQLKNDSRTSYKIKLINDRPHSGQEHHHVAGGAQPTEGDFKFYYDAFVVSKDDQFMMVSANFDTQEIDPEHPCSPIMGSRKTKLP